MDPLERLLFLAHKAIGHQVDPLDVDAYVQKHSNGQFKDLASLEDAVKAKDNPAPGMAEGLARSATKGLTFGFNDEIAGAIDKLFGGDYTATRDAERQADAAFRGQHPAIATGSEIAGGLLPLLASGGASAPVSGAATAAEATPSIATLARAGAATGALAGAVSGAGNSEAPTLPGVLKDAGVSGAVGGVGGAVLGAAQRPLASASMGVLHTLQDWLNPVAAGLRRANTQLGKIAPADLAQQIGEMEAVRPGQGMVADASPVMGRALRAAANVSPEVQDAASKSLAARQSGAGERLANDLVDQAGVPELNGVEVKDAMTNIVGHGKAFNKKLYSPLESMYPAVVPNESSMPLFELLTDPRVEKIYSDVVGPGARSSSPGFKDLQQVLIRLKDEAGSAFASGKGGAGGEYKDLARQFADAMEHAMPGFRAANRGYASGQAALEGFDAGTKALSVDSRIIPRQIALLEKRGGREAADAYRMGMLDDLAQQMRAAATNRDAAARYTNMGPEIESRLSNAFPDQRSFRAFLRRANVEEMFAQTQRAVAGNSTTAGQSEMAAQLTGAPSLGTRPGVVEKVLHAAEQALHGDVREQAGRQSGNMLMARGTRMQAVADQIMRARADLFASHARHLATARAVPGLLGLEAPSLPPYFLSRPENQ